MAKPKGQRKNPVADLDAFARALLDALAVRDMTKTELAERAGCSPSSMSSYTLARDRPDPGLVFRIEQVLGMGGGQLSRLLGYCPCEEQGEPSFEAVVMADARLAPEHKATLLGFYRGIVGPDR